MCLVVAIPHTVEEGSGLSLKAGASTEENIFLLIPVFTAREKPLLGRLIFQKSSNNIYDS